MRKRIIVAASAVVLAAGLFTGSAFAQDIDTNQDNARNSVPVSVMQGSGQMMGSFEDMVKIMQENGFGQQAEAIKNNDYAAMDEFMNNISDEDYNKMIDILRQNGYGSMADMMQSIGKYTMINMHNSMGGAVGMARMHR